MDRRDAHSEWLYGGLTMYKNGDRVKVVGASSWGLDECDGVIIDMKYNMIQVRLRDGHVRWVDEKHLQGDEG